MNINNNQLLLILITISILFFVFILPNLEYQNDQENNELKEQFNNLSLNTANNLSLNTANKLSLNTANKLSFNTATNDDGLLHKIDQKICSNQCCKFTQWPVNFNTSDPNNNIDTSKYIGSNFSCNNGQTGGGCVCYESGDNNYLTNHGQDIH